MRGNDDHRALALEWLKFFHFLWLCFFISYEEIANSVTSSTWLLARSDKLAFLNFLSWGRVTCHLNDSLAGYLAVQPLLMKRPCSVSTFII